MGESVAMIIATVISQATIGGPMLIELARALSEEIHEKQLLLQNSSLTQFSIEEDERRRLQELEDRQLAHEIGQKERKLASENNRSDIAAGDTDEDRVPRFDFSRHGISTGEP